MGSMKRTVAVMAVSAAFGTAVFASAPRITRAEFDAPAANFGNVKMELSKEDAMGALRETQSFVTQGLRLTNPAGIVSFAIDFLKEAFVPVWEICKALLGFAADVLKELVGRM